MVEITIRLAAAQDVTAIQAIVQDAYRHYIRRIGQPPAPMTANYSTLVDRGIVWVVELRDGVAGVIVLQLEADHLLVSNVAVASAHQCRGLGRRLLEHAEAHARRNSVQDLRLYTHELMHENVAMYTKLGWQEYDRGEHEGFRRVFMRKRLAAEGA